MKWTFQSNCLRERNKLNITFLPIGTSVERLGPGVAAIIDAFCMIYTEAYAIVI